MSIQKNVWEYSTRIYHQQTHPATFSDHFFKHLLVLPSNFHPTHFNHLCVCVCVCPQTSTSRTSIASECSLYFLLKTHPHTFLLRTPHHFLRMLLWAFFTNAWPCTSLRTRFAAFAKRFSEYICRLSVLNTLSHTWMQSLLYRPPPGESTPQTYDPHTLHLISLVFPLKPHLTHQRCLYRPPPKYVIPAGGFKAAVQAQEQQSAADSQRKSSQGVVLESEEEGCESGFILSAT